MPKGNLANLLHNKKVMIDWNLCIQMALDAARGILHLHEMKPNGIIVHFIKIVSIFY